MTILEAETTLEAPCRACGRLRHYIHTDAEIRGRAYCVSVPVEGHAIHGHVEYVDEYGDRTFLRAVRLTGKIVQWLGEWRYESGGGREVRTEDVPTKVRERARALIVG